MLHIDLLLLCALLFCTCQAAVVELTADNFDELTSEKTVFINFCTSWSKPCKRLEPEWGKLSEAWESDDVGLIGYVDCSVKSSRQQLCRKYGVNGFPTLKYGNPQTRLMEYSGGRTFEDLQDFAKEALVPMCTPQNLSLCDASTKALLEQYLAMSMNELKDLVETEQGKIDAAEAEFRAKTEALQNEYEVVEKERDESIIQIREGAMGALQMVHSAKMKLAKREEATAAGDEL